MVNQSNKTDNLFSAFSLDCLCQGGPPPCSCLNHYNTRPVISLCSRPRLFPPHHGLVNPESVMEASRSAGALCVWLFMAVYGCVGLCSCDSSGGEDGQARRGSNHISSIPTPHPNLPRRFKGDVEKNKKNISNYFKRPTSKYVTK